MASDLEKAFRYLMKACVELGHVCALEGMSEEEAVKQVVGSSSAQVLLDEIMPLIVNMSVKEVVNEHIND